MDIIGTWKVTKVTAMDENFNAVWKTPEEFKASPVYDENDPQSIMSPVNWEIIFLEGGVLKTSVPAPENVTDDELKEAIESGELEIIDGRMVIETNNEGWKEENGKFYLNLGESAEPDARWQELEIEDGEMEFMSLIKIRKI